jgi:CBS-domain-containing membrane protein
MDTPTRSALAGWRIREVVTALPDTPLSRCAQLMHDEHVGSLVIVEQRDGRRVPTGMVTDRDIAIEAVAFGIDPRALNAADLMSSPPALAREEDDLMSVLARMREHGVRRLPVVGREGELRGIVAADDLLGMLAQQIDGLASLVEASHRREARSRAAQALGATEPRPPAG